MAKEVLDDDKEDISLCEESDIVLLGIVVCEVLDCAETVRTPMEAKEMTVASVASTTVLAMVVFPSWTLISTAVASIVVSGARAITGAAVCPRGICSGHFLVEPLEMYLRRRSC